MEAPVCEDRGLCVIDKLKAQPVRPVTAEKPPPRK